MIHLDWMGTPLQMPDASRMDDPERMGEIARAATLAAPSDYVRAMRSLYRTDGEEADGNKPSALDIAFERLVGELRLFPPGDGQLRPRLTVGEFELRRRIGVGGMGSVYLAWSHSLNREVALKILHIALEGSRQGERLLREARCLAKVKHPNVVQIHQIDGAAAWALERPKEEPGPEEQGRTAIIVMEYVDGPTLADWLKTPRPWRDVLAVFLHLARGLAAAHRCGLLHCDITPRNILIDAAGTAKLIDFGLSRHSDVPPGDSRADASAQSLSAARSSAHGNSPLWAPVLTIRGSCGTPGYAAPEQLQRRGTIDARSDIFSLCVSLWQALSGALPYAADSLDPRTAPDQVHTPHLRTRTWPSRAPKWLRDILVRGLSFAPARRPPNMAALVAEIEARLAPRRPWLPWLAATAVTALTLVLTSLLGKPERPPFPLASDDPGLEQAWNPRRASQLAAALTAAGGPLERARPELLRAVDAFVSRWNELRASAWTGNVAQWPRRDRQLFGACLVAARHDLARILRAIEAEAATPREDHRLPHQLHRWLVALRPPTHCADADTLTSTGGTLGDLGLEVPRFTTDGDWHHFYTRGYEHFLADRLDAAEYWFARAFAAASPRSVGRARSRFRLALIDLARDRTDAARGQFSEVIGLAEAAGDHYIRLHALKHLLAQAVLHPEDANLALAFYHGAIGQLHAPTLDGRSAANATEESELHTQAAWLIANEAWHKRGVRCPLDCTGERTFPSCAPSGSAADAAFACAYDLSDLAAEVAPSDELRLSALLTRARIAMLQSEPQIAEDAARRAAALEGAFSEHTALLHEVLALLALERGETGPAEVDLHRALAALEARGQGSSLDAARVSGYLAVLAIAHGDTRTAYDLGEQALRILDRHGLPAALIPDAIELLETLGHAYTTRSPVRDEPRGIHHLRRALRLAAGVELGREHLLRVVSVHTLLARAAHRHGAPTEARDHLERAAALLPRADDPERAAEVHLLLAELDLKIGARATARTHLHEAAALLRTRERPPPELELHARWLSARLGERHDAAARELARSVADALDRAPELIDDFIDPHVLRAWLSAKHKPEK